MADYWINTNEAEDVAGSVRHAIRIAQFVQEDPLAFKWILLALHSALQGACICHLTTTAQPLGAVTERNAGEWIDFFEKSRTDPSVKAPKTYLMTLPDLLKAVRKPHSAGDRRNDAGVTINDAELTVLRNFNDELRNQFVHFEPMGWSIEVSGVPELAPLIARIIKEIVEIGWAFRHQEADQIDGLRSNLEILAQIEWGS